MKKGNLPLKFYLTIIILGVALIGFSAFSGIPDNFPLLNQHQNVSSKTNISFKLLERIRNNQLTGKVDPRDIEMVQKEMKDIGAEKEGDIEWKQIGPDNYGGSTRSILFDNQNTDNPAVYAGATTGGLWKSTNLGITWHKINIDTYNLNVSSMTQTSNGDIYVGTGELFNVQDMTGLAQMGYSTGFMGQGIFKSTDGEKFQLLEATKPQISDVNSDWAFVSELANDPTSGRVYAATNTGLKYSNDGGASWSTAKDTDGNVLSMNTLDVKVSSDGSVIACIDFKCYISTEGNVNGFINRSTGDSVSLPASGVGRIEFAFAPSDANIVYASVAKTTGEVYNIYRSDDKGVNWRIILPGTTSVPIFNKQGIYDNVIAVFPNDPGRIIIGGVDAWQGIKYQEDGYFEFKSISESLTIPLVPTYVHQNHHVYAFIPGSNNKFFVGTDGGIFIGEYSSDEYTYQTSNRNYFTTQFYTVANSGVKKYVLGGSQNNGVITMPGVGNTSGEGYQLLQGVAGGPGIISSIVPNVVVFSTVNGSFYRSDDYGTTTSNTTQFPGDVGNPNTFRTPMLLAENFNNQLSGDSVYFQAEENIPGGSTITVRSHNEGQPFYYKLPQDVDLKAGDSIQVQDVVTAYFYVGVLNGIYFAKNLHQFNEDIEWFTISNSDFGLSGKPYSMAISKDGNHLFVGTLNGKLFRISNLATAYNFERADVSSPGCIVSTQPIPIYVPGSDEEISQVITSISVDPEDPNNVMITLGNYGNDAYVLYSSNALDQVPTFISRQGNLPHMPVYSSIIEMKDSDVGILGTEYGIFRTNNLTSGSPNWKKQYGGMGSVPVFDLKQQLIFQPSITLNIANEGEATQITYPGTNNWGTIYAATYGRGVFMSDTYVGQNEYTDITKKNETDLLIYPNPVKSNAFIEFNAQIKTDANLYIYDLSGRMVKTSTYNVQKGLNKISLEIGDLTKGTYIIKLISGEQNLTGKFLVY